MSMFNKMDNIEDRVVTKADKVWLESIVRRQKMVVEDLMQFAKLYDGKLDGEVVGSLVSIYEILRDSKDSIIMQDRAKREYVSLADIDMTRHDSNAPREYIGLETICLTKPSAQRPRPNYR